MTVDSRTADAYARALVAARAALAAPGGEEARAACLALEDVTDADELRHVIGALAWLSVGVVPARVRRGVPVGRVLDGLAVEVTWRAS